MQKTLFTIHTHDIDYIIMLLKKTCLSIRLIVHMDKVGTTVTDNVLNICITCLIMNFKKMPKINAEISRW